jgi:hypothetical protein
MQKAVLVFVFVIILCGGAQAGWSQDSGGSRPAEKQVAAYHVDFSINELDDGKQINTRHYSISMTDDEPVKDLKIGTRVPVDGEQGKFDYLDVGTSILCRMIARPNSLNSLSLQVKAEISNFAVADPAARGTGAPLIRQMTISGGTLVIPDKPVIIGSVDDPNSKHQFQLQVTVTKLR